MWKSLWVIPFIHPVPKTSLVICPWLDSGSMSIGDNALLGDERWGGLFGIEADFVAVDDVKVLSTLLMLLQM